jgi:salicylate hydroxylase
MKHVSKLLCSRIFLQVDTNTSQVPNILASRDEMLDMFGDFDPKFLSLLDLAEDVGLWQLRTMPELPTWVNNKACLLGDSAHAMIPSMFYHSACKWMCMTTTLALFSFGTRSCHGF